MRANPNASPQPTQALTSNSNVNSGGNVIRSPNTPEASVGEFFPYANMTAPTVKQTTTYSVTNPLPAIKSEWRESMVLMNCQLNEINNLLREINIIMSELKALLGGSSVTSVDDVIKSANAALDSKAKFGTDLTQLDVAITKLNINTADVMSGANANAVNQAMAKLWGTIKSIKEIGIRGTNPTVASRTPPLPTVNNGLTGPVHIDTLTTNNPDSSTSTTPASGSASASGSSSASTSTTQTTASTPSSTSNTASSSTITTTAQTSNTSTQTSASNTATQTLPLSSTNSGTSTTATNTANTQAKGVASKPSSKGGTSTSVSGVTTAATGGSSNASAGKSASLTINANSSADKKFMVYEKAEDLNKNMEINHKKSIKFLESRVKEDFSFNIIGFDSKERKDLNFTLENEIQVNGSEINENQLIAINNFFKGEIISTGQEAQLRLVLRIRMDRLNKEIKKLSS